MGVVRRRRVVGGGVHAIVALRLVVVHVHSIGVRLRLGVGGVAGHVVGGGGGPGPGLRGVAAGVRLRQVGHAARVGVDVSPSAPTDASPGAVVSRDGILDAGLAGVGRAVVQDLGAVAAAGRRQDVGPRRRLHLHLAGELGLRLQAAAALAEVLRCVLRPAGGDTSMLDSAIARLIKTLHSVIWVFLFNSC